MKSWQTTVAGAIAAILGYFGQIPGKYQAAFQIAGQVAIFALGLVAKQYNVTGGSVRQ